MKRGSADVGLLLMDGYDLLGVTTQLEDNVEAMLQENTPFGAGWTGQVSTGLKQAEIKQEGYYDDAANSINAALSGQEGLSRLLCYGIEGNAIGRRFIGYSGAMQVNYVRIATRGEIHRANAEYKGSGQVDEGAILHPHSNEESDGDTELTPVSVGAQTTAGGVAYLQVSDITLDGATDVTITIRHSTDEITWEDLVSFTAVAAAPASERKVVSGTVKKHLAVSWEFDGGTDPEVKFFVGFKRS